MMNVYILEYRQEPEYSTYIAGEGSFEYLKYLY